MAVGWRASRRGPRAWTHEWARVAPRNRRRPVNPARISRPTCGGSRTPPIFHEVVTPDGLSLSGCLLYPRCGRKSSVKSLRPASSCLLSLSPPIFFCLFLSLSLSVFLEPAEKGLLPIWLGGEIKRFTVHRTVNRLRARVRRFRPIYIDIYSGGTKRVKREREKTKEGKNGL